MTLELAKQRRLEALNKSRRDRILVKPAAHHTDVALPALGTVADYLLESLGHGCRVAQLQRETGWSRSSVLVNLFKMAKKSGIGIRRKADTLYLVLPEGAKHMYPRPRIVATESARPRGGNFTIVTPAAR